MPIDAIIIHQLRCAPDTGTALTLGKQPLPIDDQAGALLDALKSSFLSRLTREHGSFASEGEPAPLPRELAAFADQGLGFVELTTRLMSHWKALLDAAPLPLDAEVICVSESQGDAQLFYLLVAGYKTAFAVGQDLAIGSTRYLDLGPSLFGIKVDLHEWRTARHYAYLSLVPPRGERALAGSFTALTGFAPGLDKVDNTEAFLAGVEAFAKQVDREQAEDFRHQVVDYCARQEQCDAPVDLGELARSVDGIDGERFRRFMADYTPEDDSALMMDRRSLRRYVKFAGREKDLAISFSSFQLNSRVHYNPDKDTLSIDGIPRGLREQLLKHLNK
jgi:nucleoid-associated protein